MTNTYIRPVYIDKMPPKPKGALLTDWFVVKVPTVVWGINVPLGSRYRMYEGRDFGVVNVDPPIEGRTLFKV
jgi:hypothetical protein